MISTGIYSSNVDRAILTILHFTDCSICTTEFTHCTYTLCNTVVDEHVYYVLSPACILCVCRHVVYCRFCDCGCVDIVDVFLCILHSYRHCTEDFHHLWLWWSDKLIRFDLICILQLCTARFFNTWHFVYAQWVNACMVWWILIPKTTFDKHRLYSFIWPQSQISRVTS